MKGTKVSNRRVTDDKYGITVGELSLKRENIQELFQIEGHIKIYKNTPNVS